MCVVLAKVPATETSGSSVGVSVAVQVAWIYGKVYYLVNRIDTVFLLGDNIINSVYVREIGGGSGRGEQWAKD